MIADLKNPLLLKLIYCEGEDGKSGFVGIEETCEISMTNRECDFPDQGTLDCMILDLQRDSQRETSRNSCCIANEGADTISLCILEQNFD
jgi:hypothetical protein